MFYEIIQVLVHGQISTVQVQVMSDKRGATVSGFNMCGVWTSSYTAMRQLSKQWVSDFKVQMCGLGHFQGLWKALEILPVVTGIF